MEKEKVFLVKTSGLLKAYNEGCPDVKKVLTNLFGTEWLTPVNVISIGDKYLHTTDNSICLLCQVASGHVAIVEIDTGNRWNEAIRVNDVKHISEEEMDKITNYHKKDFKIIRDYQPGLRNPRETNKS